MRVFSKVSMLLATTALLALGACTGQETLKARDANHTEMAPAPMLGLKSDVYLSDELQESIARLNGMETTLGRLQSDLQGMSTAMMRIESMRQEIDALNVRFRSMKARLETSNGVIVDPALTTPPGSTTTVTVTTTDNKAQPTPLMGEMTQPNAALAAVPAITPVEAQISQPVVEVKAAEPKKEEAKPVATATKDGVNAVRIGTHDKSVRIVFDVAGKTEYTSDLDSANKLLTVELPNTKWSTQANASLKNNPLIASYAAQPSGEGSVIVFVLKGDTKIASSSVMKAENGKPARIVIDLAK